MSDFSFLSVFEHISKFIEGHDPIRALFTFLVFIILAKAVTYIVKTYFQQFVRQTENTLDDELLDKTEYPFVFLIILVGLIFSFDILGLNNKLILVIQSIIILLSAYIIGTIFRIILKFWEEQWSVKSNVKIDNIVFSFFDKIIFFSLMLVALIFILRKWNVSIGPIITSLGIAGVIVGFGLKDSFSNIFSGVFLIFDKSCNYNDTIKLSSGEFGNVLEVGFRSTKVKTFDNEVLIIPNSVIANSVIKNYAKPNSKIRSVISFSVEYGNDPKFVEELVLNACEKIPHKLDEPKPFVYFEAMGEYGLKFKLYFWVNSFRDKFISKSFANKVIYSSLNEAGINIPFPTHIVYKSDYKKKKMHKFGEKVRAKSSRHRKSKK